MTAAEQLAKWQALLAAATARPPHKGREAERAKVVRECERWIAYWQRRAARREAA